MYRPRYCRECGQPIERERWRSWHSLGFCDRCRPRFHLIWMGRTSALIALGVVIGFGLGSWDVARRDAPAPLLQMESQPAVAFPELGLTLGQEQRKESPPADSGENRTLPSKPPESSLDQSPAKTTNRSKSKTAQVSLCGAPTKSGKTCRRRVKGGGRCYQHREK